MPKRFESIVLLNSPGSCATTRWRHKLNETFDGRAKLERIPIHTCAARCAPYGIDGVANNGAQYNTGFWVSVKRMCIGAQRDSRLHRTHYFNSNFATSNRRHCVLCTCQNHTIAATFFVKIISIVLLKYYLFSFLFLLFAKVSHSIAHFHYVI